MVQVTVDILQHRQTGKIHIVELELSDLRHCYCSLNRRRPPEEQTIDLEDSAVCETCVKGFLDDKDDEAIENLVVEASEAADVAQIRDGLKK